MIGTLQQKNIVHIQENINGRISYLIADRAKDFQDILNTLMIVTHAR